MRVSTDGIEPPSGNTPGYHSLIVILDWKGEFRQGMLEVVRVLFAGPSRPQLLSLRSCPPMRQNSSIYGLGKESNWFLPPFSLQPRRGKSVPSIGLNPSALGHAVELRRPAAGFSLSPALAMAYVAVRRPVELIGDTAALNISRPAD